MSRTVLGIETSCDDTAVAVVCDGKLLSSVISSQLEHARYGGVVPELASRDHQKNIVAVVREALAGASISARDVEGVAVTYGPGLAGSLLVGLSFAKAFAAAKGIPVVGVNHLEGHVYSVFIENSGPEFPFLCLIVSGGHTMLVEVDAEFRHTVLGTSLDDAAGEAFDKVAKMLGLPYPGGPHIDQLAATGNPSFHAFPRARLPGFDYSFSGIKTSVLYYLNRFSDPERTAMLQDHLPDICASFQQAVVEMLLDPLERAVTRTSARNIAVVGGVSANSQLRQAVRDLCNRHGFALHLPASEYCMDNAAMIALAGQQKLKAGVESPLTLTADPAATLN